MFWNMYGIYFRSEFEIYLKKIAIREAYEIRTVEWLF